MIMQGDQNNDISSKYTAKKDELHSLTNALQDWKEFLNLCQNILLWKKFYYGYCIAGVVSLIFLLWWYVDASVLTTLAVLIFFVATADLAIPSLSHRFGHQWDGEQEHQFESVCQQLLNFKDSIVYCWNFLREKKANNAVAYIVGVHVVLFTAGLLGYWIDNVILLYLIVLGISLYPGLSHHGIIQQVRSKLFAKARKIFDLQKQKKK